MVWGFFILLLFFLIVGLLCLPTFIYPVKDSKTDFLICYSSVLFLHMSSMPSIAYQVPQLHFQECSLSHFLFLFLLLFCFDLTLKPNSRSFSVQQTRCNNYIRLSLKNPELSSLPITWALFYYPFYWDGFCI